MTSSRPVQLRQAELETLRKTFSKNQEVILFGSRARGTARPFSDVDLCLKFGRPLSASELASFREALQNSSLPYLVDLVDYETLSPDFQRIIDETGVPLSMAIGTP